MSGGDWNSFAARTAYNEVNRHLSREGISANLPLDCVSAIKETVFGGRDDVELFFLIEEVWQETCKLTLRQRQSLLLHSQELIIYFLQIGITEKKCAELLNFSESEWADIRDRLPMTDAEIAERTAGRAGAIKKARHDARVKLGGSILI